MIIMHRCIYKNVQIITKLSVCESIYNFLGVLFQENNNFGTAHSYGSFYLNGTLVDSVTSHKDLGIVFDNHLKFHDRLLLRLIIFWGLLGIPSLFGARYVGETVCVNSTAHTGI